MIKFFINGKPQGKARARTLKNGVTYTPPETVKYEKAIKNCYIIARNDTKLSKKSSKLSWMDKEPIAVKIVARFAVPESYTKKRKENIAIGAELPVKKPDADNIAKVVCDALNGVAYHDDTQVVELNVKKIYAKGNKEGVWVTIRDIWEKG